MTIASSARNNDNRTLYFVQQERASDSIEDAGLSEMLSSSLDGPPRRGSTEAERSGFVVLGNGFERPLTRREAAFLGIGG